MDLFLHEKRLLGDTVYNNVNDDGVASLNEGEKIVQTLCVYRVVWVFY